MSLTLEHFRLTGIQDCQNGFDPSEIAPTLLEVAENQHRLAELARDIAAAEVSPWRPEQWIGSAFELEDFEHLDPVACFVAWRDGWGQAATEIMREHLQRLSDRVDSGALAPCEVCGHVSQGNTCCP
jgi:hypothetical protein